MSEAPRSSNVVWQQGIQREQRWAALGHGGATVWMTGLPASGKSTVAAGVEARLLEAAGVVVLVALVSPYRADRDAARAAHDRRGLPFLEVWVATSLEECERRDPKGLYARARAGELTGMTGVDDPYEPPESPDVVVRDESLDESVARVIAAVGRTSAG